MNINKMIREEFHKILKEEDPPAPPAGQEGGDENPEENPFASFMNKAWNYVKDAGGSALAPTASAAQPASTAQPAAAGTTAAAPAAPKEVVFQNKNATSKNCRKIGEHPPNSIGLVCVQNSKKPNDPKSFSVAVKEGFVWVDKDDENNLAVKTSNPAIIKKYIYVQQVRISQQIYNVIAKIVGNPAKRIKRVGEIQGAVELLRKYFPLVGSKVPFPSKQKYRDLTTRLQAILTVISKNPDTVKKAYDQATSEVAKEKNKTTKEKMPEGTRLYAVPAELISKGIPFQRLEGNLPDTMSQLVIARQQDLISAGVSSKPEASSDASTGGIAFKTAEPPKPKTFSPEQEEKFRKDRIENPDESDEREKDIKVKGESKLIRKMIIQEVRKSRILKEEETRIYDPAKEEDQDFFKMGDKETLDQFNDRIRNNALRLDMQNKSSTTAAQPVTPTAPQAATVSPQVALAQQIMFYVNQAVGQRFDVSAAKMKSVTSLAGIQQEVNVLRRSNPDFPSRVKIPDLTKRLQAILAWVKTNPDKVKKTLLAGQVPLEPMAPAQSATQQESKLIRKMIIQEVHKALRK